MRKAQYVSVLVGALLAFACGEDAARDSDAIEVRRDSKGVVHITARTDADAYYGAGYMQAADRLFQMDLMRRRALGRRAELLGPSVANDDELMRKIGIRELGAQNATEMRRSEPEAMALIDAWVEGVNARIAEVTAGDAPLPYGFGPAELDYAPEPWTSEETLAVGKMIVFGNANQIQYDLLATVLRMLAPDIYSMPLLQPIRPTFIMDELVAQSTTAFAPRAAPELDAQRRPAPAQVQVQWPENSSALLGEFMEHMASLGPGASNNWAIDGKLTENGRPILANDPHQPLKSPSLMWAHHMNSADREGTLDVAGFGFVGTPSVQLGHNRHVAWAATTTYPDMMDVWDVVVEGKRVRVGDSWVEMTTRVEQITIAGEEPRSITVEQVPGYGVLLPANILPLPIVDEGHRLLLNWTGFRPTREALGFQRFNSARTLEDFEAAVDLMEISAFNFLGATKDGISYRSSMLVPDQGPGTAERPRWALLDGNDPASFWSGEFIPLEQLPRSRGGARGYVVTANNDPFGFTENGRVNDDPFYFGAFFDPGTRADRIESELSRLLAAGKLTVAQMQALQADTYSVWAEEMLAVLSAAWQARATDAALAPYRDRADFASLIERLSSWDRKMVRSSSEAVVFNAFAFYLVQRAVADEFSFTFGTIIEQNEGVMLRFGMLPLLDRVPNPETLLDGGKNLVVLQALEDTVSYLTEKFGGIEANRYRWGDVHGTQFDHPVWPAGNAVGFVPTDGSVGTVNVSDTNLFTADDQNRLKADAGAIFRSITEFDADGTPVAHVNFPPGNAGEPDDPHFADTLSDWVENRSHKYLFSSEEIAADTEEQLVLER